MNAPAEFRPGTIISGRFEVINLLGRGGMASVYRVRDVKLNRPVALKLLADDASASVAWTAFAARSELVGNLSHSHILPLHDSGEWLVGEVENATLAHVHVDGFVSCATDQLTRRPELKRPRT